MKLKALLTAVAALLVGATFAVADDDTPLAKEMSAMNKALRTVKRQAADPAKKADNLELLGKIKEHIANSIKLQPAKTKDQPEAGKAGYLSKYEEQMKGLDKAVDDLKTAIEAGKGEDAAKIFEKLGEIKEKGHKDFAPEE